MSRLRNDGHNLNFFLLVVEVNEHGIIATFQQQVDLHFSAAKAANGELRNPFGKKGTIENNPSAFGLHRDAQATFQNKKWSRRGPSLRGAGDWIESRGLARAPLQAAEEFGQTVQLHFLLKSSRASKTCPAIFLHPYFAIPLAMIELSCGQTEPLWYDSGLYRDSVHPTVRIPQPVKNSCSSGFRRPVGPGQVTRFRCKGNVQRWKCGRDTVACCHRALKRKCQDRCTRIASSNCVRNVSACTSSSQRSVRDPNIRARRAAASFAA